MKTLSNFISFLQNLWGILAGLSIFFPLSNVLTQRGIPLDMWDTGGFAYIRPETTTAITTLVAVYIVFSVFGNRDKIKRKSAFNQIRRQAKHSFFLGLAALVFYISVYLLMREDLHHTVMGWDSDDLRRLIFDVVMLTAYVCFFGLITKAFTLLGMIEYLKKESI